MRLVDIYWMETHQTRQMKTPDLRVTDFPRDDAEQCRLRKIYVPMTSAEYDLQTDSVYEISDPPCGGTVTNKIVTLQGARYLERSYSENNIVGTVKTFWILKDTSRDVTDMVRYMGWTSTDNTNLYYPKPDWYDTSIDKMELYSTRSDTPGSLPKNEWDTETGIDRVEVVTIDGVQKIHIKLNGSSSNRWYGLWLYHSTGGADLRSDTITEAYKTATVQSFVLFFPMQSIPNYDSSKDLLWVFNGGDKRFDYQIVQGTYNDSTTAEFWVFDRGVSGTVNIQLYQSTATPPVDVSHYTESQVEEGLRNYTVVTTEVPHYVCGGCIQTGDTRMTRTPNNKFFEMSDGTCAVYPSETAKAETVLELECTEAQASAIDKSARRGELLLAGLRCGADMGEVLHPPRTGYRAYPNGQFEIEKMYACANIYSVRMPIRFDVSGETYRSVTLPVIYPTSVTIDETADSLTGYSYRLIGGAPAFVRNQTLFLYGYQPIISLGFRRADDDAFPLTGCTASIWNSAVGGDPSEQPLDSGGTILTSLEPGRQDIEICIKKTGLTQLRLRLPIYVQAVSV